MNKDISYLVISLVHLSWIALYVDMYNFDTIVIGCIFLGYYSTWMSLYLVIVCTVCYFQLNYLYHILQYMIYQYLVYQLSIRQYTMQYKYSNSHNIQYMSNNGYGTSITQAPIYALAHGNSFSIVNLYRKQTGSLIKLPVALLHKRQW